MMNNADSYKYKLRSNVFSDPTEVLEFIEESGYDSIVEVKTSDNQKIDTFSAVEFVKLFQT